MATIRTSAAALFAGILLVLAAAWPPPAPAADGDAAPAAASQPAELKWLNVTRNVGGDKWGYAGVTTIACVPGTDEVIAGVSEAGLWSSTDGGQTWSPMGEGGEARNKITNRPSRVIFDPKDPKVFWTSGCYGPGVFKTADGGKSFQRLGDVNHVDGLAIDFADPRRQTMVAGLHEQARSLMKSADGGASWQNIGKNLPDKTNHSTEPILIDAKTYVTNTAGWLKDHTFGIYRTADGGETWEKVSDLGAAGRPLVAADGAIYWVYLWGGGIIKSTDQGKTWQKLAGPVKAVPIELPGGRLAAAVAKVLYTSADGGKQWHPCGPAMPFAPATIAFCDKRNCFYASRMSDKKTDLAILRLDLPKDPASFFEPIGAIPARGGS